MVFIICTILHHGRSRLNLISSKERSGAGDPWDPAVLPYLDGPSTVNSYSHNSLQIPRLIIWHSLYAQDVLLHDSSWVNFTAFQCDGGRYSGQWYQMLVTDKKIKNTEIQRLWELPVRQKAPSSCKIGKGLQKVVHFCITFRVMTFPSLKSKHAERHTHPIPHPHQTTTHRKNAHRPTAKNKRSLISTRETCPGRRLASPGTTQATLQLDNNRAERGDVWVSDRLVRTLPSA